MNEICIRGSLPCLPNEGCGYNDASQWVGKPVMVDGRRIGTITDAKVIADAVHFTAHIRQDLAPRVIRDSFTFPHVSTDESELQRKTECLEALSERKAQQGGESGA